MRFGFVTDTHFTNRNFERKDNYFLSVLQKFQQVYDIFEKQECEFVIHGGDIFDQRKIYAFHVLLGVYNIVTSFSKPTYFILGQHDLSGYNKQSYEDSSLHFISSISNNKLRLIDKKLKIGDIVFHPSHCYDDLYQTLENIPDDDNGHIVLAHHLLHNKMSQFKIINTKDLPYTNANLVLSGDLHDGYERHEIDNTTFYNPGAMSRQTKHCKDRKVKCAVVDIDSFFNSHSVSIVEHEITMLPNSQIFDEKKIVLKSASIENTNNFTDLLSNMTQINVKDVFHIVEQAYQKNQIEKELYEYILRFKNNKDNKHES